MIQKKKGSGKMKGIFYLWMAFQILVGIWLFVSPLVLGVATMAGQVNNMIFGALVVIFGLGVLLYEYYHTRELLVGNFVFAWLTFQFAFGIWLFISPFVLEFSGAMHLNNMIFGAVTVLLAVGTAFFEFYHREGFERRIPAEQTIR